MFKKSIYQGYLEIKNLAILYRDEKGENNKY